MHAARRDGLDIQVALRNGARAAAPRVQDWSSASGAGDGARSRVAAEAAAPHDADAVTVQAAASGRLTAMTKRGFGLREPIRRFAAYTRRYFTDPVRQDISRQLDDADLRAQRSLTALSEMVQRDMQRHRTVVTNEMRALHEQQMSELAAARLEIREAMAGLAGAAAALRGDGMHGEAGGPPHATESSDIFPGIDGELIVRTAAGPVVCPASDHRSLAGLTGRAPRQAMPLAIARLVKPGRTCVDVHAGVGVHVLAAARALNSVGQIVAFEPDAVARGCLTKTCALNGITALVDVRETALGEAAGALDDTIPEHRVDVLRIDTSAEAFAVLRDAERLVRANPEIAVIVGYDAARSASGNPTADDWRRLLAELGLEARTIAANKDSLAVAAATGWPSSGSGDLLLARKGAAAWEEILR